VNISWLRHANGGSQSTVLRWNRESKNDQSKSKCCLLRKRLHCCCLLLLETGNLAAAGDYLFSYKNVRRRRRRTGNLENFLFLVVIAPSYALRAAVELISHCSCWKRNTKKRRIELETFVIPWHSCRFMLLLLLLILITTSFCAVESILLYSAIVNAVALLTHHFEYDTTRCQHQQNQ